MDGSAVAAPTAKRLRSMLDEAPILVAYVDREERYQFNNLAYARWFGDDPSGLRGRTVRELVGEVAYRALRPHVEAALAGDRVSFSTVVPYRQGGARHVVATYEPDRAPDGRVLGFFAYVMDVTREHQAEERLRLELTRSQSVARGVVRRLLLAMMRRRPEESVQTRRALGRALGEETAGADLQVDLQAFAAMGLGHVRLVSDRGGLLTFEATDSLETTPRAAAPSCYLALGFLEGLLGAHAGAPALGTETACQARGAPACVFAVRSGQTRSDL